MKKCRADLSPATGTAGRRPASAHDEILGVFYNRIGDLVFDSYAAHIVEKLYVFTPAPLFRADKKSRLRIGGFLDALRRETRKILTGKCLAGRPDRGEKARDQLARFVEQLRDLGR